MLNASPACMVATNQLCQANVTKSSFAPASPEASKSISHSTNVLLHWPCHNSREYMAALEITTMMLYETQAGIWKLMD
jgi:hypothetical protein